MRVGKRHISGLTSHVSIASLVERILAVAMEILKNECGPFWPNFAVFAIVCHIGTTVTPWGTESSQEGSANIVANNQGLNAIEFRICSSGSSGVIHLLVRSMISPFCTACCFLPHPRVHPLDEQQAASVTASHNPGHGTRGDIKGCESRLGASISPTFPTLDGRPRRPILPFWQLWTPFGLSPRQVAWRSLGAKCMGVSVGLLVDRVWNGISDLQASVEIYYQGHLQFWLI